MKLQEAIREGKRSKSWTSTADEIDVPTRPLFSIAEISRFVAIVSGTVFAISRIF